MLGIALKTQYITRINSITQQIMGSNKNQIKWNQIILVISILDNNMYLGSLNLKPLTLIGKGLGWDDAWYHNSQVALMLGIFANKTQYVKRINLGHEQIVGTNTKQMEQ